MPRHDVFISYAHLDNEPDLPNQQGWVSIFQGALRKRLSKTLGREVDVWWDQRELRGDRIFDQTIREACEASALMVAVVSPRYVQSESCRKELAYFTSGDETNVADVSRLLTVGKTPVNQDQLHGVAHPVLADVVSRTLGYRFYHTDEATKRVRELHIYDPELGPSFQRKLEELAQDLAAQLNRAEPGHDPVDVRAARDSGIESRASSDMVFLAATTSDVAPLRDAIQLELADKKVPVSAPVTWSEELQSAVAETQHAAASASVAVHILGAAYGSRPDGSERSLPELQFEQVTALSRARPLEQPLIRLVWIPTLAAPVREAQRTFIARLRAYDGWGAEDELLGGTREELAARIEAKLEFLREQRLKREREGQKLPARPAVDDHRATAAEPLPRRIYVISEQHDHDAAQRVERALALPDWEVLSAAEISNDADTEQERERQHQAYLEQSDAFLIFHGDAKFRWVRAQADEVRKAMGRRGQGVVLGSVYVAKPLSGPRASYQLAGIRRVDDVHEEPRENLRPFLDLLAARTVKQGAAE